MVHNACAEFGLAVLSEWGQFESCWQNVVNTIPPCFCVRVFFVFVGNVWSVCIPFEPAALQKKSGHCTIAVVAAEGSPDGGDELLWRGDLQGPAGRCV